jgi:Ca-activated chloride channel homolog
MSFSPFMSSAGLALLAAVTAFTLGLCAVVARIRLAKKRAAFGPRTNNLVSAEVRTSLKAVLLGLAVLSLLVALARPQGGTGKRHWVQTSLDVVIVLDYSKSMYARDIPPSRIDRAKIEVSDLIRKLSGARFAAIAFAGEPMSFPLSSDGNAVAQFFRQLSPSDMPVGGTATAKALERARELLKRDSQGHERVIVLVTDGEDLEGDPVRVAEQCREEGNEIHVVQIGTSAPEMLPEMDEQGNVVGTRRDNRGRAMTTSLSADGEAQLKKLAEVTGGTLTRATKGKTGIAELASLLQKRGKAGKREEVVTGRDEWFAVPLGLGILLLLLEMLVPERKRPRAA